VNPSFGVFEFIALFGASQGLFLAFVFLSSPKGNRLANRFLGLLMLVFSLRLLEIVAFWSKYLLQFPHFLGATYGFHYLFGVLLYLYVRQHVRAPMSRLSAGIALHFIPFLLYEVLMLPYYFRGSAEKLEMLKQYYAGTSFGSVSWSVLIFSSVPLLHVCIYLTSTVWTIRNARQNNTGRAHVMSSTQLGWIRNLTIGFGAVFALWFLYGIAVMTGFPYHKSIDYAVTYAMTLWIYSIGYFALDKSQILSGFKSTPNGPKYRKSTLTEAQAEHYLTQLEAFMHNEKPYLDSELTLNALAKRLSISPHHLSQIINGRLDQTFFDYINSYRVEAVKKMLLDPRKQHFTLLGLAYEAGFNNKTSFNVAFKRFTGTTPSEYRHRLVSSPP